MSEKQTRKMVGRFFMRIPNKQFFFSLISLFIVTVMFISGSMSWFTIKVSDLEASTFSLECGKGLRVNDSGTSEFSVTEIEKRIKPASSVNGRNLFFPTDGSDFSAITESMTFRSANVSDKNENYLQIDLSVTAQENNTALYLNTDTNESTGKPKTYMSVKNNSGNESSTLAAPLRMAIWTSTAESGIPNTPIVFNPSNKQMYTNAVEAVDRSSGRVQGTERQVAHTFDEYTYGGTPIAVLSKGVETKISIVIWLEGADPKCTHDKMSSVDKINLGVAFNTSWDKTQTIRFKDTTATKWISANINNHGYNLRLRYDKDMTIPNSTSTSLTEGDDPIDFAMYQVSGQTDEWYCNMPGDMTKTVRFILTDGSTNTYEFTVNDTDTSKWTLDRDVSRLYEATDGTLNSDKSKSLGHWVALGDSDGGANDEGDLNGDDF